MSAKAVNNFTSNIMVHLYASQNATGNMAFSGVGLYILMGTINTELVGRSHYQLSRFLEDGFERNDNESVKNSKSANKIRILRYVLERLSLRNSAMFHSCYLYDQFQGNFIYI
ncbi:hypothetical protein RF11_04723 [Thelohanellus kitauei]|uniref:Uncharacterized protein n=1 Tax=Thelohanellus kitauei TaxID=669202 RepID=A0A0C2IPS5_THEKT|nr:hypothetical protein RF11_04723 [Thelohanellus kitauei]